MGVIESKSGALGSISGIGANGADSTKLDGPRINVIESSSNYGGFGLARDDNRKEKLGNLHFRSDVGVIGSKSSVLGSISGLGSCGQGGADLGPFSTPSSMHDQGLKPSYAKAVQNSSHIACEVRSSTFESLQYFKPIEENGRIKVSPLVEVAIEGSEE
ncbi:hypothetical protein ACOSQ4_003124 [Xanthoceras sorbifolium]